MTLPENLLKAATLGTDHQTFEPDQLLLLVATSTLREQAGYIAGQTTLPLPNQSPLDGATTCSDRAMDHLRLMLSNIHTESLQEWLIAAANAKLHVQPDVLPKLLLLGQKKPIMRPYLYPVLGQRVRWLSSEITNQNWGWVLKAPEMTLTEAIAHERLQEQELIAQMSSNLTDVLKALGRYHLVWSNELTDAFIKRLENSAEEVSSRHYWFYTIKWILLPLAYHFPFEASSDIIQHIKKMPIFNSETSRDIQAYFDMVLNFRHEMLAEIARGETL